MTTSAKDTYNILITSTSPIFHEGVKALIKRHTSQQGHITEVNNMNEMLHMLAVHDYKAVIIDNLDAEFPTLNMTELKFKYPSLKLLYIHFQTKNKKVNDRVHYLSHRATDESWKAMLNILLPSKIETQKRKSSLNLSQREKEILKTLVSGKSSKEISELLHISLHTVSTHRKNIINKLGIKTISGLTIYAVMNDIIRLDEMKGI